MTTASPFTGLRQGALSYLIDQTRISGSASSSVLNLFYCWRYSVDWPTVDALTPLILDEIFDQQPESFLYLGLKWPVLLDPSTTPYTIDPNAPLMEVKLRCFPTYYGRLLPHADKYWEQLLTMKFTVPILRLIPLRRGDLISVWSSRHFASYQAKEWGRGQIADSNAAKAWGRRAEPPTVRQLNTRTPRTA